MDNLPFIEEKNRWVLTECPSTGDEVVGCGSERNFTTPIGQARWWKCPACGGWHVMMKINARPKEKQAVH